MQLHLNVTEERMDARDLTIDERLLIMGLSRSLEAERDLLAWFVTDEQGEYLSEGTAKRLVGKVKKSEEAAVWGEFQTALIKVLLPKPNASSSLQPSETMEPGQSG